MQNPMRRSPRRWPALVALATTSLILVALTLSACAGGKVRSDPHADAHAATDLHAGQGRHGLAGVPHRGASHGRTIADAGSRRGSRCDADQPGSYGATTHRGAQPNRSASDRRANGAAADRCPPAVPATAAPKPPPQPTAPPAPPPAADPCASIGGDGCKWRVTGGPSFGANGGSEIKLQLLFIHSGIDGGQPQGSYFVVLEKDGQNLKVPDSLRSITGAASSGSLGKFNYEYAIGLDRLPGNNVAGNYTLWVLDGNGERDSRNITFSVPAGQGQIWIKFDQS